MTPIALTRIAFVKSNGFDDERELATALLELVDNVSTELVESQKITNEQRRGLALAKKDIPLAFSGLQKLIDSQFWSSDEKADFIFLLTKLMDDMMSLGSVAMIAGVEPEKVSLKSAGSKGGKKGAATRQANMQAWQAIAKELFKKIVDKNHVISQDDIATNILQDWTSTTTSPPGHTRIKQYVAELQKAVDG